MERNHYDLIQKRFLQINMLLFRVQDGGFMKEGKMISAQKGVDFWGIVLDTWKGYENEYGKAIAVEAKEDTSLVITESLLKKIRPTQFMRMNLIRSKTSAHVYLTTYNPEDKKVRIWIWENPKPEIGTPPVWIL